MINFVFFFQHLTCIRESIEWPFPYCCGEANCIAVASPVAEWKTIDLEAVDGTCEFLCKKNII